MKPSERIKEIANGECEKRGWYEQNRGQIWEVLPYAIVQYLDEQAEKQTDSRSEEDSPFSNQPGFSTPPDRSARIP